MSTTTASYGDIFREVTTSAKQLIQSEVALIKTEIKDVSTTASSHIAQAITFGALLIVSAVPLLASAVIALGNYWDGNYALSALVVGLACAAVSGFFVYRAVQGLQSVDMTLPASASSLAGSAQVFERKADRLVDAVKGES